MKPYPHAWKRLLAGVFGLAVLASTDLATAQAPATQPTTNPNDRTMTVRPRKADDTEGVFDFSQNVLRLRDENAATLYLQAFNELPSDDQTGIVQAELMPEPPRENPDDQPRQETLSEQQDRLMETPVSELNATDTERFLNRFTTAFHVMEPAQRRTWSDWGAPLEEQGIHTLLPYLNSSRYLASALSIRSRSEAAAGNHEASADSLRQIFLLAHHTGNSTQPVLIDGLVGVGVASLAMEAVTDITEVPDAPNRYWALTTLPTPMFEFSKWMRAERNFLFYTFPALREPELMTADRWVGMMNLLGSNLSGGPTDTVANDPESVAAAVLMGIYAAAHLQEQGFTQEELERRGVFPVLAQYMVDEYLQTFDRMAKFTHLPYPEATARMAALEDERLSQTPIPVFSLANFFLPSLSAAYASPHRLQRQIDAMRIVEAVRDYAFDHDGLPPASLDEVRLPIPEDVMTGKPFGYAADGGTFTITAEPYNKVPGNPHTGFTWTVTLRASE